MVLIFLRHLICQLKFLGKSQQVVRKKEQIFLWFHRNKTIPWPEISGFLIACFVFAIAHEKIMATKIMSIFLVFIEFLRDFILSLINILRIS